MLLPDHLEEKNIHKLLKKENNILVLEKIQDSYINLEANPMSLDKRIYSLSWMRMYRNRTIFCIGIDQIK